MGDTKSSDTDPHISIGIGVVCWIENNDQLPELKRCLDSLTDFYPVIVVNGKWNDMEGEHPTSTPETYELIESYSNTIQILSPNQPEFVNRNWYLIQAMHMDLDYLIWVDTDEYVELPEGKDFFMRHINEDGFTSNIHCEGKGHGGHYNKVKLYHYPGFLRHRLHHNQLFFKDTDVWKIPNKAPMGIIVHHDKSFRDDIVKKKMLNRARSNPIH